MGEKIEPIHRSISCNVVSVAVAGGTRQRSAAARDVAALPLQRLVPLINEKGETRQDSCADCLFVECERNQTRACCKCCNHAYCVEAITGRACFLIVHLSEAMVDYYMNDCFQSKAVKKMKA